MWRLRAITGILVIDCPSGCRTLATATTAGKWIQWARSVLHGRAFTGHVKMGSKKLPEDSDVLGGFVEIDWW